MAKKRQVIHVPGVPRHKNPIPNAVRLGNMIFSSSIGGYDPKTGEVPKDAAQQVANAFANVRLTMEAAGGTTDDIGRILFYVHDMSTRELLNKEWLKMFPDEENRPVRKVFVTEIPKDLVVQIEVTAVVG
ncbi:MAG TPA: RidA family protein [Alphaproteobacteria bacterium]|jgi:2-iminobutanoate/2-iminopropanoate deaminase|nr:RidA family protein [Alphaproteobacteria bacterium]